MNRRNHLRMNESCSKLFTMKNLLLILFILISSYTFCQNKQKGNLNISYSSGENIFYSDPALTGDGGYTGKGYFIIGVNYSKPLNRWLNFNSGLDYSLQKIETSPAPMIQGSTILHRINLVSFPFSFKAVLLKYFYFQAGASLDLETGISHLDNQTGIGLMGGIGAQFNIKRAIFFVSPFIKRYSFIRFDPGVNAKKLYLTGLQVGLGYQL